jgi:BASS family bile acid:Na+ symporter
VAHLVPVLINLSLAAIVVAIGMRATRDELLFGLRRPAMLFKAVIAVDLVPPLAAAGLLWFLPLDPPVKAAIMLMAIAPVPPLVPAKALAAGGRSDFTIGIYVALSLLTIAVVPVMFALASESFGRHDRFPVAGIAMTILTSVVVPLAIGIGVRRLSPSFAGRAAPRIAKLSPVLLAIAFLPVLFTTLPAMIQLAGNGTLAAMAIVSVIATAAGHLLGGPNPEDRVALAVTAAMRHPGIAIVIASATFHDSRVVAAVLLFLIVGIVVGAVYRAIVARPVTVA